MDTNTNHRLHKKRLNAKRNRGRHNRELERKIIASRKPKRKK